MVKVKTQKKPKGFSRRSKFYCSVCLCVVMEYSGAVVNKNELVCPKCSAEWEAKLVGDRK